MSEITTAGLDLAKNVFHVVCCDRRGKELSRRQLKRREVLSWFANVPACVVGMEACAGAHYWGRALQALGHEVRLLPAQYVKAYRRGNKNDYNDARAVVRLAARKSDPLSRWITRLTTRRGVNKATVALANKLARIGWALLRYGTVYQPSVSAAA